MILFCDYFLKDEKLRIDYNVSYKYNEILLIYMKNQIDLNVIGNILWSANV